MNSDHPSPVSSQPAADPNTQKADRDKAEQQTDCADAQHKRIEEQDTDDALPRPRHLADVKVHKR